MKIVIEKEELTKGLSIVGRAIPSSSPLLILENVLIKYDGAEKMTLFGTNMEIAISVTVPCSPAQNSSDTFPFSVAIPMAIIRELSSNSVDSVTLSYKQNGTRIGFSSGNSTAEISCTVGEEFPEPKDTITPVFSISTAELKNALQHTTFAAAKEATNPVLEGVYISTEIPSKLLFVATDGFRCSVHKVDINSSVTFSSVIPAKSLNEVSRVMLGNVTEICRSDENNKIVFRSENVEFHCFEISGDYFDWKFLEQTSLAKPQVSMTLSTSDLYRAMRQVAVFSGEMRKVVLDIGETVVNISAKSQKGNGNTSLTGQITGGEGQNVILNYDFASEVLSAIETQNVHVSIVGKSQPVLFRCEGKDNFYHSIMPIVRMEDYYVK